LKNTRVGAGHCPPDAAAIKSSIKTINHWQTSPLLREAFHARLANHRARARWKEISVDRLFAAKIVTSDESQGSLGHYLNS
jgi:hypothetical protein